VSFVVDELRAVATGFRQPAIGTVPSERRKASVGKFREYDRKC